MIISHRIKRSLRRLLHMANKTNVQKCLKDIIMPAYPPHILPAVKAVKQNKLHHIPVTLKPGHFLKISGSIVKSKAIINKNHNLVDSAKKSDSFMKLDDLNKSVQGL